MSSLTRYDALLAAIAVPMALAAVAGALTSLAMSTALAAGRADRHGTVICQRRAAGFGMRSESRHQLRRERASALLSLTATVLLVVRIAMNLSSLGGGGPPTRVPEVGPLDIDYEDIADGEVIGQGGNADVFRVTVQR